MERIKNYYKNNYRFPSREVLVAVIFGIMGIGGIIGFIYETLFYLINDGHFVKRGTGFGPWINIYGIGAFLLFIIFYGLRKKKLVIFFGSAIFCGVLEYIVGYCMYTYCGGLRTWNYNTEIWNFGNIGGFVCLRSVLVFAFMGLLLMYVLIPMIEKLSARFGERRIMIIMVIIGGLFLADLVYNDLIGNFFDVVTAGEIYGVEY